jgi:alpha-galactosidase
MKLLQIGISQHPTKNLWYLVTNNSTYVIGIVDDLVLNFHWGPRLATIQDVKLPETLQEQQDSHDTSLTPAREEFPVFGGLRYGPDVLRVEFSNGTRELDLVFNYGQVKKVDELLVVLNDRVHKNFTVELTYKLDIENDLIIRGASLKLDDSMADDIVLRKAQTGAWHLGPPAHGCNRELITLAGAWSCETQVQKHSLRPGTSQVLQSKRGMPSAQAYPYFAIKDQNKDGEYGDCEVYFGTLAWSGNWSIEIATDIEGKVRIIGGYHDRDFNIIQSQGQEHILPEFVAGYSDEGLSGARKRLTRHIQSSRDHDGLDQISPVLFNGWEACGFDVNMDNQLELAKMAAKLGAELFVVDDGWFKGRKSDNAGLGDWYPDKSKFPQGLGPLANYCHELGMKFGLWFEPEMVNPDSDLYRQHPDWVYHYPDRVRHLSRNQLVLDITRDDVRSYIVGLVRTMVSENGIDYIKWDMNRPLSEVNSKASGREVWLAHVRCVYDIIRSLKQEFSHLRIETCCSGGGRADMAILKLTDICWPSDNTRPDARLKIQYGSSLVMPPNLMSSWVTDMPSDDPYCHFPISYRFHVSFMGALGIGSNLRAMSGSDLEQYAGWVELYKKIRPIQQLGNLDFLVTPSNDDQAYTVVTQTTLEDASVVLAFRESSPFWLSLHPIRLRHLKKLCVYRVQIWKDSPFDPVFDDKITGNSLLSKGLEMPYLDSKAYSSVIVLLTKA